ncbi:MAG: hypothetical protein AAF696_19180 [Bacteroidota bacterium]
MEEAYSDNTLDLYLSGELSEAEQEAFEKRLDMDESLRQELEIALKAKVALHSKGITEQKAAFAKRWDTLKNEGMKPQSMIKPLYIYLAAAAVALLLLFIFLRPEPKLSNQELAMAYYEAPLASSIREIDSTTQFKYANIAFQQKRYGDAARSYLNSLADSSFTQRDETMFYAGISFFEEKDYQKALNLFSQLSTQDYVEMKEWYTALTYLMNGQENDSKNILLSISSDQSHFYKEKAVDLLKAFE